MGSLRDPQRGTTKDRFADTKMGRFRIFFHPWDVDDFRNSPDWPDGGFWQFEPDDKDAAECSGGSEEFYHSLKEARRACLEWVESRFDRDSVVDGVEGQAVLSSGTGLEVIF